MTSCGRRKLACDIEMASKPAGGSQRQRYTLSAGSAALESIL